MTNPDQSPAGDRSLDAVLAEAVTQMEAGRRVDLDAIKATYPEVAEEIDSFMSFSSDLQALMSYGFGEPSVTEATNAGEHTEAMGELPPQLFDDTPPTNIGRFEVLEELGEGSFGRVYVAYDELINRKVAIKQAKHGMLDSADARRAYLHEARAVAQLDHPAIVKIKDVRDAPDEPLALILQYVEGPTLTEAMAENDHPREEMVEWIAQIADALHYAHQRKVVHRDLKPANVVVTTENGVCRPVLLDFGLATIDEMPFRESGKQFAGTALYTSPEQASKTADWATAQSDIFSLGAILYQLLTGELPFRGRSRQEVLQKVKSFSPASPMSIDDTISRELDRVCRRALEKRPSDRYASAADMAREIRHALQPRRKTPAWIPATMAVAATGLVLTLGWTLVPGSTPGPTGSEPAIEGVVIDSPVVAPPATPLRPALDVKTSIDLQANGLVGEESVIRWEPAMEVEADDRFKLTAETNPDIDPGPIYTFWFKPDGTATQQCGGPGMSLVECPGRDAGSPWHEFGQPGVHLLIAITTPRPLEEAEINALLAAGEGAIDRLELGRSSARSYFPALGERPRGVTRGTPPTQAAIDPVDSYPLLGALGSELRSKDYEARFQATFLRVSPDSGPGE